MAGDQAQPQVNSPWVVPLRRPVFRDRLIASIISNTGSWMQDTAGTWLMTALTTSPLLISLMQTAATLPVLLFGLPAGAMADIFDRRRLLLFWAAWMLVAAVLLSAFTLTAWNGPCLLLVLTCQLMNLAGCLDEMGQYDGRCLRIHLTRVATWRATLSNPGWHDNANSKGSP